LTPYRLQVQLLENRRDGSNVCQEHVATLGAIAAWLLPEFWVGIDAAAQIKADNWDIYSVQARLAFWEAAKPRLDRLANRLDPKAVRMEIHRRIPWPKQAEREIAEAREDFRSWSARHQMSITVAERHEKLAATATAAKARERASVAARAAADVTESFAKLTVR
jgi:hypothetical protein